MDNRKKVGSKANYYSSKENFRDDDDEFSEKEKIIGFMLVAALLISALIILAGATYTISVRSTSPFYLCLKTYEKNFSKKETLVMHCQGFRNVR